MHLHSTRRQFNAMVTAGIGSVVWPPRALLAQTGHSPASLESTQLPDPTGTNLSEGWLPAGQPIDGVTVDNVGRIGFVYSGQRGALRAGPVIYAPVLASAESPGALIAYDLESLAENWRFEPIGGFYGVAANAAIVRGEIVDDTRGALIALDLANGTSILWEADIFPIHATLLAGDLIIVSSDQIVALDAATGERRWTSGDLPEDVESQTNLATTTDLIVTTGTGGRSDQVFAFEPATGDLRWQTTVEPMVNTAPLLIDDLVIVAAPNDLVFLDPVTGEEVDRVTHALAMPFQGHIAATDAAIIVANIQSCSAIARPAPHDLLWTYRPIWGVSYKADPVFTQSHVLLPTYAPLPPDALSTDQPTIYEAVDIATGAPIFEAPRRTDVSVENDTRDIIVGDGTLIAVTPNGLRHLVDSAQPYEGIRTPLDDNRYESSTFGYSIAWSDPWQPLGYHHAFGDALVSLSTEDGDSVVMIYTRDDDYASSQEAAADAATFPLYFGPDTSRLRGLTPASPDNLPSDLPEGMATSRVDAQTVFNEPYDEMSVAVLVIAIPNHDRWLVMEMATRTDLYDDMLPGFHDIAATVTFD